MKTKTSIFLFIFYVFLTYFHLPLLGGGNKVKGEWKRVYFCSYPRCGNHWIRSLVETCSGIATGSVYRDKEPMHMNKVFPWGGYACKNGYEGNCSYPSKEDCVFIKTHFPCQDNGVTKFDQLPYKVAIRVVRHPVDSFYSRYVKNCKGKLQDKVPSDRVKWYIKTFKEFQKYWDKQENVVTFCYEDLLENPFDGLKEIMRILEYNVTDDDISRAIAKHPPEGKMLKSVSKFKQKDLKAIYEGLADFMEKHGYLTQF